MPLPVDGAGIALLFRIISTFSVILADWLVNDTILSLCGRDVKHERLPKKVMAVAHSMVSYVPGSAPRQLHKIATCLIGTDTSALLVWLFLCLAYSGQLLSFTILAMLSLHMILNGIITALNGLLKNNICRQEVQYLEVQWYVKQTQASLPPNACIVRLCP